MDISNFTLLERPYMEFENCIPVLKESEDSVRPFEPETKYITLENLLPKLGESLGLGGELIAHVINVTDYDQIGKVKNTLQEVLNFQEPKQRYTFPIYHLSDDTHPKKVGQGHLIIGIKTNSLKEASYEKLEVNIKSPEGAPPRKISVYAGKIFSNSFPSISRADSIKTFAGWIRQQTDLIKTEDLMKEPWKGIWTK